METVIDYFLGSKITAVVTAAMKLKDACILEGISYSRNNYVYSVNVNAAPDMCHAVLTLLKGYDSCY